MNLEFKNFPYNFNIKDNFFLKIFSDERFNHFKDKKIIIYGSYPNTKILHRSYKYLTSKLSTKGMSEWQKVQNGLPSKINRDVFNIWVTYENRRPQSGIFDATLSFDLDDLNGTNFYLPLIYLYMDLLEGNGKTLNHGITQQLLMNGREFPVHIRDKKEMFVVTFINNPHPTRMNALIALSEISEVKTFGRYFNNYVIDKIEEGKKYWFSLCFENDLYPGYVTEKLLEAYLSYSVPLYWGDDAAQVVNPKAVINLKNFISLKDFVNHVNKIYKDKEALNDIITQPLLAKTLDIEKLKKFLFSRLSSRFPL